MMRTDDLASLRGVLPRPRAVRPRKGEYRLAPGIKIVVTNRGDAAAVAAAKLLQESVRRHRGWRWSVPSGGAAASNGNRNAGQGGSILIEKIAEPAAPGPAVDDPRAQQWYALRIRPDGIHLRAVGAAGLRYGVLTLGQLIAASRARRPRHPDTAEDPDVRRGATAIRAMDIEDWPDFAARGVMLDISRDKVPTLATLERLIDLLAGWKINQLQLYTEHTFAYAGHERVWRGASPLTGPQIEHLDRYCRERGVELVPNQNSFGHMERWLKHAAYADLAEVEAQPLPYGRGSDRTVERRPLPYGRGSDLCGRGSDQTAWGGTRTAATTLNPLDPRGLRLVASLYDQLLPHFYSRLFNVGGDETWELGQGRSAAACRRKGVGRVYLDYLRKLHREVRRRGRRMMFWADIAQQHPELIAELPDDVIPLVWGYEADHPFDAECARPAQRGLEFYVCPGTSSWCSFAGRSRNCLANLRRAAESGVRHGASGYLVTDWGDFGHRQYLPASYLGFLYGAAVSWCGATNAKIDAARAVSRYAFGDATGTVGRLWFEAGAVHELSGVSLKNRTVLFAIMRAAFDEAVVEEGFVGPPESASLLRGREGRWRRMERRIDELRARAERAKFPAGDGALARDELLTTLTVLRHACRRGRAMLARRAGRDIRRDCRELAADMRRIMRQHRRLWLARNRPGGLRSSMDYYRRNLREYLAGSE
jgi:hypothetical protein